MTTPPIEAVQVRTARLRRELALAIKWDRPAILLAIYSSEYVRADVERELSEWLREQGQRIVHTRVTGQDDADAPQRLRDARGETPTVFFVSGLGFGAPTSYRALNLRREYLVQDRVRAVFWLTEREAVELAQQAPDFWAFRGRTVEFLEAPEPGQVEGLARELAYWDLPTAATSEDIKDKIALRQNLLAELPPGPETEAARAELLYTLGGTYWAGGQHREALQILERALPLAQSLEDIWLQSYVHNRLGNIYRALKQYDQAIAAFRHAIELAPNFAYPHNGLGSVYRDLKQYAQAIAAFQRAIELAPNFAYPHNGLGNVYRDQKRYDQAIAAFQHAIELYPSNAYPYNGLGNVYYDLKQYDQAIAAFQRAIELAPNSAYSHNCLGNVYRTQKQYKQASAAYQRAIELDPKRAYSLNGLGAVYYDLKQYVQAIAAYQRAIELDPNYTSPHNNLGNVYRDLKQYEQASAAYQRALELDPDEGWAYASLASIYRRQGDEEQHAAYLAEARRRIPPDDDYTQACLASIAGDADAAIAYLARALEQDLGRRAWAREDPDLDWIRDDARYEALLGVSTNERMENG